MRENDMARWLPPDPRRLPNRWFPISDGPGAAEALVAANSDLERITIEQAGDLPQLEQPDATATVIDQFLA